MNQCAAAPNDGNPWDQNNGEAAPRALETYLQRRTKDVTPAVSIDGLIDDILHKYFAKYKSGMTVQQALEAGIIPVNLRCLSACKLVRIGG